MQTRAIHTRKARLEATSFFISTLLARTATIARDIIAFVGSSKCCALVVWLVTLESVLETFYMYVSLFCIFYGFLALVHLHRTPSRCDKTRIPSFGYNKFLFLF